MKTVIVASLVALMSSSVAFAEGRGRGWDADLSQVSIGVQDALNKITDASKALDVSQTAVNAANLINLPSDDINSIEQKSIGSQLSSNFIEFSKSFDANAAVDGVLVPSTQSATNVANSVSVEEINDTLKQYSDTAQVAKNIADSTRFSTNVWDLKQTSVNAANLVTVAELDTRIEVSQLSLTDQFAMNKLDVNGAVTNVVQSATNVANSIGVATGQ
ncbi:hypothetical protein FE840_016595 [Peteryoungia desertarenae]|uniref:Conjugal transfer protein n=1 Tax=Peteryoungia desertarenae TaxID=1813451 RepID=A0ABX6QRG9_9HYPH|nr:hypothetical protein [Peteryoungia desertarenae]QLF71037.1 hypothetical protein FE840_016595 [Peteryoungia desertarenae]